MAARLLAALAAFVILSACANDRTTETEAINRNLDVTVRVNSGGHGAGVFIAPGKILTAEHVVRKADSITVVDRDGQEMQATLARSSEEIDVAVLNVNQDNPHADLDCRKPVLGEPLLFVGHPGSWGHWFIQWARASSTPQDEGMWVLSGAAYPGNSGGPVFDVDGSVVGLISAVYTKRIGIRGGQFSDYALMRSSADICDWLEGK